MPVYTIRRFASAVALLAFATLNVACDGSPSAITAPEAERIRLAVDQNQKDFGKKQLAAVVVVPLNM